MICLFAREILIVEGTIRKVGSFSVEVEGKQYQEGALSVQEAMQQ
jgi:hypothetical protein